ncbi:MAG: antibiotic biosynthesis monooxygenase family protein [Tepidiformaceae bacterium]
MYGTIALLRVKPGHEDALLAQSDSWWNDRVGRVDGAVSAEVRRSDADPSRFFLIVTFESKAKYVANASDPEQDAWYRGLVENLAAEPEWLDGEIIAGYVAL